MKNLYLIFFVFSIGVFSQQKTIGEFTELIVKDGLHVTMVQGDTNAISITSKNEDGVCYQQRWSSQDWNENVSNIERN